jgi:hypothetical protein
MNLNPEMSLLELYIFSETAAQQGISESEYNRAFNCLNQWEDIAKSRQSELLIYQSIADRLRQGQMVEEQKHYAAA